ncbi:hypothetical protein [Paenibacillus sp. 1P03SA]|uniref:hypothetical protein n=1 Tax=Paenibacillus sp. 1P03SA TaxID=3132294 RepID=UPI0039A30A44
MLTEEGAGKNEPEKETLNQNEAKNEAGTKLKNEPKDADARSRNSDNISAREARNLAKRREMPGLLS